VGEVWESDPSQDRNDSKNDDDGKRTRTAADSAELVVLSMVGAVVWSLLLNSHFEECSDVSFNDDEKVQPF
jgi:hypothetical protein